MPKIMQPLLLVAVVLTATAGCAGRGGSADNTAVRDQTLAFFAATTAHDGDKACAALAPRAAKSLESDGSDCGDAIDKLGLSGGTVNEVQVWGDRAQVRLTTDTVFLARFPQGWRLTAAGCEPRPAGPYECDVEA